MKRSQWPMRFLVVLFFGLAVGTISAQEGDGGGPYGPRPPEGGIPVAGRDYIVSLTSANRPGSFEGAELAGPRQPIRDCLRQLNFCCWSHHDCVGCSSLKSECAFIFGSCRTFYSEPCWKGPPALPSPYDTNYGTANYGTFASPGFGRCENCR
jgi:hypothetical protein